ncbi:hypothetical protein Stsp02_12550 [Streptomyces sp. NBRC 14336]|uniref:hypothetical protein n=1 Tax=Streptomyces sp. NBRC 14336 TaxID=3030992 RepID=UPI0024A3BC7E|nr:hypothetical protein [Streptomyces sp. NBRC 14336]WBO78037.1 hypothetical protein SBE_001608 [Streptomyces sp. SBE_14.2]GLW45593.1 hypothetical protein Stsp02_12550 [Streptomyces sp. NBRC 14336]
MAASAHLLLTALSKPEALTGPEPHVCVFSSESACAETPLTSEPPLPAAEPLTSEPPLHEALPLTSEPPLAAAEPLTGEAYAYGRDSDQDYFEDPERP